MTEAVYLITKYGGYYRQNCQGYTSSPLEAGRYTLEEAIRESHPNGPDGPRDGIRYVHQDDAKGGTVKSGSRTQSTDLEQKSPDNPADNQEPVKNPEGFTEELKAICAARCDDEAGEPPCYQLPELVEPCEHITPCAECKADAKARAALKGGDA